MYEFEKDWIENLIVEIYGNIEHTKKMLEYAKSVGDKEMVNYYAEILVSLL